jgi:O-6-methylguanine DNA methyltransferase
MKINYSSPVGCLTITIENKAVCGLTLDEGLCSNEKNENITDSLVKKVFQQLNEYFAGKRKDFDLPLNLEGTDFQKNVWNELLKIPYGTTISYKTLSERVKGNPNASRAVGNANGKNPIAIIVPCHRVVAHDGSLGGYSLGLKMKEKLLELERTSI